MKIGLIGVGVVGGTLLKYLKEKTTHEVACWDPAKGLEDDLTGCAAIFISVPVPAGGDGQDLQHLRPSVDLAKTITDQVYVRSTVLPGTNDELGTIAMPEFLTERRAYQDFCELPILVGAPLKGKFMPNIGEIFPEKKIVRVSNTEAELAKFTHNCFGAMKVTYFNIIHATCEKLGANFDMVKLGASLTGFIGEEHTQVPGPDGKFGFGGKCFPENIAAMKNFMKRPENFDIGAYEFFNGIEWINFIHRSKSKV